MKKQRILSSLLAVAMTFSLLPSTVGAASGAKVFSDVSKDSWYYKYVDHVAEEGYFGGTSATTFSPDMTMDRAQFAVVLAAVEGVEVDNNVAPFADVPAGTWYSGAVAWAAENGIVAGGDNNKYYPTTPINREQMAVIMNAYINWHNNEQGTEHNENVSVDGFADAKDISSWAVAAVDACRTYGLIAGSDDGNFYPKASATRAQVATVIYNLSFFMLGGGGGGGGKDYIYDAINDTLVDISKVLVTTPGLMYDKDTKEVSFGYNIYDGRTNLGGAMITTSGANDRDDGIILKANNKIVKDGDIKTRPQEVTLSVDIGEDTLYTIANYAWDTASAVVYGTMTPNEAKEALKNDSAEIREQVKGFISDFENATDINLSIEQREAMVDSAIAYAKDFGGKVIENFTDDNGKYYTGDITVSVGENKAAKTVINVGETASFSGDKSDAVVALASAIARALHGDLATKCPNWTPVTDLSIEAVVNVTFSGNTVSGYKTATDKKPYAYPITLALEFNSAEVGSYVHYGYFYDQDNVKLIIPYGAQQKYEEQAAIIVNSILNSEQVNDYINNMMGRPVDEIMDEALDAMMDAPAINDLKAVMIDMGKTADQADTLVNGAMNQWVRANYAPDAEEPINNLYPFIMLGEANFDNTALYTLMESIAVMAADEVAGKVSGLDMDDTQDKLDTANEWLEIAEGRYGEEMAKLVEAETKFNEAKAELTAKKAELPVMVAEAEAKIEQGVAQAEDELAAEVAKADAAIAKAEANLPALTNPAQIAVAEQKIAEMKDARETLITEGNAKIAETEAEARAELAAKVAEAEDMIDEYEALVPEYEEMLAEAKNEAGEAAQKMASARLVLNSIQAAIDQLNYTLDNSTPDTLIPNLETLVNKLNAIDQDKLAELNSLASSMGVSIDASALTEKVDQVEDLIAEVEALDETVQPYVLAAVCDALAENVIGVAGSYTAPGSAAANAMHAYIDTMIVEQAGAAVDSFLAQSGESAADIQAYREQLTATLNIFKDFDRVATEITMDKLVTILNNTQLHTVVDGLGKDSLVAQITALIAKLPENAEVSLAGITLNKSELAEMQAADTASKACIALANILDDASGLCLDSFTEENFGENLTVKYKGRTHTIGLYIHIADGPAVG